MNLRHHWSSEIYGQGKAFRKLLHFPKWFPLLFTSDHGTAVGSDVDVRCLNLNSLVRLHTTWSAEIKNTIISLKISRVLPVLMLHPWIQYKQLMQIKRVIEPKGSIFFAHHTSGGGTISGYNDQDCIDFLNRLPSTYHPITVCFYHPDLATNRPDAFRLSGYEVTSAGDTREYNFIDSFYKLISGFEFAFSEGWGSQVSYCVDLGIPTMIIPRTISIKYYKGSSVYYGSEDSLLVRDLEMANLIFGALPTFITKEQSEFVGATLGYNFGELKGKKLLLIWTINVVNFPFWFFFTTVNNLKLFMRHFFRLVFR